ncbi:aromatic ring-hydroxylating dioxygenase subunit alpha [Parasphingorhabdus sp.]|uniref:aromatic ring-hydroxylating dioxygenase subunit alpha n=1 Tax=Parasphingorhabdus sp. TaxID=2709688 RepID=UPI003264AA51
MNGLKQEQAGRCWPEEASRVPLWVYSDPSVYADEMERIFYGDHWSYVALEAEIPEVGDYKTTFIGERSVIVVRTGDDEIAVHENRCAHRGARFCREKFGKAKEFACPYHQWVYSLEGELQAVPFQRGVRRKGGMPESFDLKDNGLNRLRVQCENGIIWATFSQETPDFKEYLGERMYAHYQRVYDGRPLKVLGYNRQHIPANWKMMMENIKDSYHPGLLHVFFSTFGLFRADQESATELDDTGRHGILISRKGEQELNDVSGSIRSFDGDLELSDTRLIEYEHEWSTPQTVGMITVFPSAILQQQVNSLSTRQIIPKGAGGFDFVWTHFGYADDDEEMTQRRLLQANLFGPAGIVSAEDGEVIEYCQEGATGNASQNAMIEMGGHEIECTDYMITETAIRGMYAYYKKIMGF